MKNLFLTCMVLFLVFTIGCQESSITDPTQSLDKNNIGSVNHNIIGLKYQLADPRGESTFLLTGQVSYENTVISAITTDGKVWVKVRLEMVSLLRRSGESNHPPRWKIEKKTEDNMFFTNAETTGKTLRKEYSITNRSDIELCVTYLVTLKSVKVVDVFLSRIEQ
jgi:hypothetical protein